MKVKVYVGYCGHLQNNILKKIHDHISKLPRYEENTNFQSVLLSKCRVIGAVAIPGVKRVALSGLQSLFATCPGTAASQTVPPIW